MFTSIEFFGILSSIFILTGIIPYLIDIHHKKVHPHILSWIGWSFITGIGAFAMLDSGSTWITLVVFANTLACLLVVFYSLGTKTAIWNSSKIDWIVFALGFVGIFLWQYFQNPSLAIIFAISADILFGIPTIVKTWKDPESETKFVWLMAILSGFLSLFAIENFIFSEISYPIYLLLFDTLMVLLVLKIIKKTKLV